MAALTVNTLVNATGVRPNFVAATTSDTAPIGNGINTFAVYKNTDAAAKTVTITPAGNTNYGVPWPAQVYNLVASTGEVWIPLRRDYDNGAGTASATLVVGGTGAPTGVTVAVVQVS